MRCCIEMGKKCTDFTNLAGLRKGDGHVASSVGKPVYLPTTPVTLQVPQLSRGVEKEP